MRALILAGVVTIAAGCSTSSSSSTKGSPSKLDATIAKPDPTPKAKRKPRGWRAYSGRRTIGVRGMGPAADARVRDLKGGEVQLSSFWRDGKALIVFYRGHW